MRLVWQLGPPPRPLYRAQGTVPGPCECWPPKAHSSSLQTLALAGRSACSLEGRPPWRRGPEPETDAGPPAVSCFQAFVSLPVLRSITPTPHPGHHRRGAPAAPGPASVLRRAATASSGLRFSTKPAKRPTHLRMPSVENTSGPVPFVRQSLPSRETEGHERQRLCGEWFASA